MALTLTFDVGPPCAGGGHWPVTVTPSEGKPYVLTLDRAGYEVPLSDTERDALSQLLLRSLLPQLTGKDATATKDALVAKTVDLSVDAKA